MSGADDLRAAIGRPDRRRPPAAVTQPLAAEVPAAAPVERAPRTKKVRMTIDLVPEEFDQFREWRNARARELGRGRVNSSDVMIALLREMMRNEALQAKVVAVIEREGRR